MQGPRKHEQRLIVVHPIIANALEERLSLGDQGEIINAVANAAISGHNLF